MRTGIWWYMAVSKRLILLLILTLFPFSLWAGGDIYVATTGNDTTGNGSIGTPYATVAKAISMITDSNGGWNIILRGGTYNEHDILVAQSKTGTSENWNTLRSYPGEWAIIDGQRNCSAATGAIIRNGASISASDSPSDYAIYWLFERLEFANGGISTANGGDGNSSGCGIWWNTGPFTVRYCYVHDCRAPTQDENPSGISGACWQSATIEYNYLFDNGSDGAGASEGNNRNISTLTLEQTVPYDANTSGNIADLGVKNCVIRYNLVDGNHKSLGIGMKASNRLTETSGGVRSTTDYTYRSQGDKIHHNIVINTLMCGIIWQSDWTQIYNNIVENDSSSTVWTIGTRRIGSEGVDTIYPCVYNNTMINGTGLYNDMDGKYFQTWQWFAVNNIIDSPTLSNSDTRPLAYAHRQGGSAYWNSQTFPTSFTLTDVLIDRNYFYRGDLSSEIYYGNIAGTDDQFSVTTWESAHVGTDLFHQATQESGANKLYVGTTGADKYRTVSTHNLGETGKTIGGNGLGGAHPYLAGVTIPSYIGATNPSDDDWVAGVLGLATDGNSDDIPDNLLAATAGSDPTWIEGGESTPPSTPSAVNVLMQGVGFGN